MEGLVVVVVGEREGGIRVKRRAACFVRTRRRMSVSESFLNPKRNGKDQKIYNVLKNK